MMDLGDTDQGHRAAGPGRRQTLISMATGSEREDAAAVGTAAMLGATAPSPRENP